MDPLNQTKVSPKLILVIGGLLVLLIATFSVLTLSKNAQKSGSKNGQTLTAEQERKLRMSLSLTPTPTYIPPPNYAYTTVDSVNFLPHTVNSYTIDQEKVLKSGQQVYPNLDGTALRNQINKDIFTWLALNEFYQSADVTKVSSAYAVNSIENMAVIHKDIAAVSNNYNLDVMKLDGFYLKLLYKGTLPANLKKLKKTESDLQPIASQLIQSYHDQAVKDISNVVENFNKNNTVILMNNRQASIRFTNFPLYPALVGDVNYVSMIKSLPVGQVSNILTLTSKLKGSATPQDYAYAVFYISKKTGTNLPIDALANAYVAKSQIK